MTEKTEEVVVRLNNVRLSFPHLDSPQVNVGDDGKKKSSYGAVFLMEPDHPAVKEVSKGIKEAAKRKWPTKHSELVPSLKESHKLCLKPGSLKAIDYPEFKGMAFVSANNGKRPKVFNKAAEVIAAGEAQFPYAGCYVNATIGVWAQDHKKYGKRINASLRGIQFLRDGEAFGGGSVAADDEFQPLEVGADDDALDTYKDDEDLV